MLSSDLHKLQQTGFDSEKIIYFTNKHKGDPQTLDPRRVRDLATTTTIHMLYEGLMRNGPDGKPAPALAENVAISPDQMTYTFTLRKSGWSDGTAVTAQDFEKSWKSMLAPEFPSPNAYQLYPIQGAQAAKEGRGSIDTVEVKAIDDATLVVNLEQPTPYFLSLLTTHFYYPVHETLRSQASDASSLSDSRSRQTDLLSWKSGISIMN